MSLAATGLGFADLRAANTDAVRLSPAELGITLATTLFVVSAMVVALHHAVTNRSIILRLVSFVFYLFFALWSVGFGYAFFWKELAGQEFTARQFRAAIDGVAASVDRAGGALATAELATAEAADLATARAQTEAVDGRTCANRPNSTPGEGPLMRSRNAFAARTRALGDEVQARWIGPLAGERVRLSRRVEALASGQADGANVADAAEADLLARLASASRLKADERRALFTTVHDDARAFAEASNSLRALHAEAFAGRLVALAADVGADPARAGSPDPARVDDPGYCWDVVLHDKLAAAAAQLRAIGDVDAPAFEFLEGPKATRAAFFGLVDWLARAVGMRTEGETRFVFDEKALLALFASLAVDLGIVFLTLITAPRPPPGPRRARRMALGADGSPKPPVLDTILEPPPD